MITEAEKIACLKRELAMRRKVYPRQVGRGQMRQDEADREIAAIEAIITDYGSAVNQAAFDLASATTDGARAELAAFAAEAGLSVPDLIHAAAEVLRLARVAEGRPGVLS